MINNKLSIEKDKIKTMQKDIISAKTRKFETKPITKSPEILQSSEKLVPPVMPEQKKDLTPPVPKIPEIKPVQSQEPAKMEKPTQPQTQSEEKPIQLKVEENPVQTNKPDENKINQTKTVETVNQLKQGDPYREKIEQ